MDFIPVILVAGLVFGLCFAIDKGFTRLFRNQQQHHSGLAVRLTKRFGAAGILMAVLGVAGVFAGLNKDLVLLVGGAIVLVMGVCLVIYYMSLGIFYDEESFLVTRFGKPDRTYTYGQIRSQQLYNASGNVIIELSMEDGSLVQVQSAMEGAYDFLDKAFSKWLEQTGRVREECDFYDPANSCWFPTED